MRRIAIFAHYDKNAVIEQYVEYNIKQLRKIADFIIFVSDSNLNEKETEKILKYTNHNIIGHHGEYDFGSYKRGFQYALENNLLDQFDELIFANDSCYAPIFPFEDMFKKMESKENIDFWGITADRIKYFSSKLIIQSYFLVFNKNVFTSEVFKQYVLSIKKEESKNEIVRKYEQGLTILLENNGYKWDVYSQFSKTHWESCIINYKTLLFKEYSPILKRSLVLRKVPHLFSTGYLKNLIQKKSSYYYELIEKDIKNNSITMSLKLSVIIMYKTIGRIIIRFLQKIINDDK